MLGKQSRMRHGVSVKFQRGRIIGTLGLYDDRLISGREKVISKWIHIFAEALWKISLYCPYSSGLIWRTSRTWARLVAPS